MWQDTLQEVAEGRLQLPVQGRLCQGRQGVGAEVDLVAAAVPPRPARLVQQRVEAALPQP